MGGTAGVVTREGLAVLVRSGTVAAATVDKAPHGASWGQILPQIAIWAGIVGGIAAVVAIVPMTRHLVRGLWRGLLMRAGVPRRRYARWFVGEWGKYDNPYLDAVENLDLRNTYVPLSFRSGDDTQETLTVATEVLAESDAGNLIIYGGPGSGKSTLLKAYGVGVLLERSGRGRGSGPVPFFVQLRKLARFLAGGKGLADYLVEKILVADAGMTADRAREFLAYSLSRRQVVVMLDGLDEVMADHYEAVRQAVLNFAGDHTPGRPTYLARMMLTCRRQNFLSLRDDWVPAFGTRESALAPLRNSEIFSYLDKTRRLFKSADGPESFMQAVRASGTLDLHRIPLILAMSVGLYARRDYFQIPSSIAELYRTMIREMLDRHSFRRDRGGREAALKFQVADKERFLREFALHAAEKSDGFDDFDRADLVAFSESLAPRLNAVRGDPAGLVDEIIQRSGLLTDVAEGGAFVFAHRSIQEYLVADQVRLRDDGDTFLLGRAGDQEWRQVVQFYTAGQEQLRIDGFLESLSARNPGLAGYCLAGAMASDEVAGVILDALEPIDDVRLPAVAAATLSPRVPVQEMAIDRLCAAFSTSGNALSAVTADVEGMLPLLNSLAGTNAAQIAALVPRVVADLPDDPRLVEPLWRSLTAPGIERLPESRAIVQRLLNLVIDPNSFEELARQDRYDRPEFLTENLRWQAYPFDKGLDRGHNLVTLLAWADYLGVAPHEPNRFFQAKAAKRLDRIEADRRRTISFSLFRAGRLLSAAEVITALPIALAVAISDPRQLIHPFGWRTVLVLLAVGLGPVLLYILTLVTAERYPKRLGILDVTDIKRTANSVNYLLRRWDLAGPLLMLAIVPAMFAIAFAPLLATSLMCYIAASLIAQSLFWATMTNLFESNRHYYFYRPNVFVDVYDDPKSEHWLGVGATPRSLGVSCSLGLYGRGALCVP